MNKARVRKGVVLDGYMNIGETASYLGISASTLQKWMKTEDSTLPKPKRLGPKTILFKKSEIDDWIGKE